MTKVKTSELSGAALDWAVSVAQGYDYEISERGDVLTGDTIPIVDGDYAGCHEDEIYRPSRDWAQGGPILERSGIGATVIEPEGPEWLAANHKGTYCEYGPTLLIAAMRCYVASKLGEEIEIPEELT